MTAAIDPRDVHFMRAVGWSEQMLKALGEGWQPPYTTAELDQVHRDAMRAMARNLPDARAYADWLEPVFADAIMSANKTLTGWRVPDGPLIAPLRSLGLIGIRDRELTCFALDVRRELKKVEAGE